MGGPNSSARFGVRRVPPGSARLGTLRSLRAAQRGNPELYVEDDHPALGYKLTLLGLTEDEIADVFGVHEDTLYRWKTKHPAFAQALADGKEIADAEVAARLYERAVGYEHRAEKVFLPAGTREPIIAEYTERFPPDPHAAAWWLKNRRQRDWRDKIEFRHEPSDLEGLTNEELLARLDTLRRQIASDSASDRPA